MQTQNCTHTITSTSSSLPAFFPLWIKRSVDLVATWSARQKQRHDLAMLNDEALRDIGLTRSDVERETAKPFWQL